MTTTATARIVVPEGAPRELWMQERGEGVTASEALAVARAGLRARRTILERKMNGSTFRGNKATDAGHARELALLDEAAGRLADVAPNGALWGAAANDLHRATPDGIGHDAAGGVVVVEVKSHEWGWEDDGIPADHLAQIQFQMHVLGAEWGLYGFEVRDEDDMPPVDGAKWIIVLRDQDMIDWLAERADAFIAWREAGCPDVDEMPESVAAANAAWVTGKTALDSATAAEKPTNAALKKAIAEAYPHAARFGAVAMGEAGGFQLTVSETRSIDEVAWEADDPEKYKRVQKTRVALAFAEAEAARRYPKITRRSTLRFQGADDV